MRMMRLMFWFWFTLVGKEYVCIVRLHEAIEKEAELAKVSVFYQDFVFAMCMSLLQESSKGSSKPKNSLLISF